MDKTVIKRIVYTTLGVIILGFGAGILRISEFGTDPFSCMNLGITAVLNSLGIRITYGVWQIIMNLLIFIWMSLWKRRLLGYGMFCNMILVGLMSDLAVNVSGSFVPDEKTLILKMIIMLIGVVVLCFGIAFYIEADMGTAPYDEVAFAFSDKINNRLSFKWCRIITDIICVTIGIITYIQIDDIFKILGVGTVIMAFGTGPLVQFFRDTVSSKLVGKK